MLKNSACFIIFLMVIIFTVPVVSTLLVYEIEIIRDASLPVGISPFSSSFPADEGLVLNFSPGPVLLAAQLSPELETTGIDNPGGFDLGDHKLYRFSGMFADSPAQSNTPEIAVMKSVRMGQVLRTLKIANDFSIRLPGIGSHTSVIVKFNRSSDLHPSAAMFFLGTGLLGIAGLRRKKHRKRVRRYHRIM